MEADRPQTSPTPESFWPPWLATPFWGPPASALLILIAGLVGLGFREPWLFPSLGPTAYILVVIPGHASAKFYNTFVSHLLGMASGILAVRLMAADATPVASGTALTSAHVYAAVIAMALTVLTTTLARAVHPPSAATTLLFALGGIRSDANGATALIVGVAIVATLGEALRLIRLQKRPSWETFLPASRTRSDL